MAGVEEVWKFNIRVPVAGAGMDGSVRKPFQLFILWQVRSAHCVGRERYLLILRSICIFESWLFKMYFKVIQNRVEFHLWKIFFHASIF